MNTLFRDLRDFFVSLKLTVVLLMLGIILVFAATLDQVNLGVWAVQAKYFHSLFVYWRVGSLSFPIFPGGYLLGGFLLVNLIAAHIYRFKFTWRKTGILLAHLGLILLLIGELLSGLMQQEYNMRINEGETKAYAESYRQTELAITDVTDPKFDDVVAIPESFLASHQVIQYPKLPFQVVAREYYPNAMSIGPAMRTPGQPLPQNLATQGLGMQVALAPQPVTYKENERNTPGAFVELIGPQGSLGTWMVATDLPMPQYFDFGGHRWKIALRFARRYEPFTLTLLKFSHDVYPGTDIPKNFSSRVRLRTDDGRTNRDVLIYMNNPLRYAGLTFYQSGYDGEHTTILQVVKNPSWVLPYVSCAMIALGLVIQFGMHLVGFATKRRTRKAGAGTGPADASDVPAENAWERWVPRAVVVAAVAAVVATLWPPPNPSAFDLNGFGRLPVLANGRFKPLDTVARSSLLQLQSRQEVRSPQVADPLVAKPTEWLLDVIFRPEKADTYPTFVIDNPDLLTLIGKTDDNLRIVYHGTTQRMLASVGFLPSRYRRFSFAELQPHLQAIEEQAKLASPVESAQRSPFQRGVLQLYNNLLLYEHLRFMFVPPGAKNFLGELFQFQDKLADGVAAVRAKQAGQPHDEALVNQMIDMGQQFTQLAQSTDFLAIPPLGSADANGWQTTGTALLESFQTGRVNPAALAYAGLDRAWRDGDPTKFNKLVSLFRSDLQKRFGPQLHKSDVEVRFNSAEPFYLAMNLYVVALLLAMASWLIWPQALGKSAFWLVGIAWLVTTAGVFTRMWLEGRPPVTNLYSSALFVGWGAVTLCLVLEFVYRNAIGSAAAGAIGFATLIIAHMLSLSGDTLEMMRAVLDSNFWLATHVTVVTLGYASTFLAGFLALIYILRGLLTRSLDRVTADSLSRMVYGIVCFATLFSFAGTVLGGIWADQSWGRFWGWDPKENGALIIVMWNAIILHARWGGWIRQRGLMAFAVFGNIVTSWSWFGTNMLGIGLHSYGFTQAAFWGLSAFVASQLAMIGLALIPLDRWRSFRPGPKKPADSLAATPV
ncbi:MAG TPA: cytochrome c biogenesis protein CcsA [Opitutaceae bacterium]|nr:cytochrome c biogenesis protein CcsA [Opitutaceae bacterium]